MCVCAYWQWAQPTLFYWERQMSVSYLSNTMKQRREAYAKNTSVIIFGSFFNHMQNLHWDIDKSLNNVYWKSLFLGWASWLQDRSGFWRERVWQLLKGFKCLKEEYLCNIIGHLWLVGKCNVEEEYCRNLEEKVHLMCLLVFCPWGPVVFWEKGWWRASR